MIITRSPLRISLGGGGTDLPSYYEKHAGFLIAGGDRQVCLHHPARDVRAGPDRQVFRARTRPQSSTRLKHPIIREALRSARHRDGSGLEMTTMADIPAGTGLGSSGSFTTALLKALHAHKKNLIHPRELAEQACHIEIDRLKEPIGKQDQYIAAYGGMTCFKFLPDGKVEAWPLKHQPGDALQSRRQSAAVLHRLQPLGVEHPEGAGRQEQDSTTSA